MIHQAMVPVQLNQIMRRQVLYSISLVPIGSMKMKLKITHSTVRLDIYGIRLFSWGFLVENMDPSKRLMIAFSRFSDFQVQLPSGVLTLLIVIRDKFDCMTEWNLSSVIVQANREEISTLFDYIQSSPSDLNIHPIAHRLASGNQNIVAQLIISLVQELKIEHRDHITSNNETTSINDFNWTDGIPVTNILVTPLGSARLPQVWTKDFFFERIYLFNPYD